MSQCNSVIVAFDTEQYIEFLKWRSGTPLDSTHYTLIDIQCGWDPDYATGVYYCWNCWELSDDAVQQYFYAKHTSTQFAWEQLSLFGYDDQCIQADYR